MAEASQQLRQEQQQQQQSGNSVGLAIENKLRELLDSQEIRNLKDNTSYRELIVRKISLLFQNIFNAEKQKVTKQFEEQYAILEEYCESLQQERMDLTFHQDKLQNRSGDNDKNMRNPLNQISNGTFTEENFENKQAQSMLMQELQRIQKYCSQLEGMLEEANQSATNCYSKNVALQQLSEDLNEQIKYLQSALLNMESKLSAEREDNKQFVLSTVAKYKGKIRQYKRDIEESQQNLQFQKEQLHKFQLLENEEKNKYQKQIQQIEAQIEQVAQHYEAVIVNMKEKNKDDLKKIEAQFQKDAQYKELEDKQMTIEMETRIRREVHESQDKIINELKKQLEMIAKENEIKIKDLETTIRRNESIIDQRNEDQRQIASKLEKSMKNVEDCEKEIERLREANKQMESLLEKQKDNYQSLQENYENATVRKECDNRELLRNKQTQSAQNQMNKVLDEKIRAIEGLQSNLEEQDRKEKIAIEKVHQAEIVLRKVSKENDELKQKLIRKQDIMNNYKEKVKIKLSRVLTDLAETKNRLTLAENKLIEQVTHLNDWAIHSITAVYTSQHSQNNAGNQEILERLAESEQECVHQEQIIMKLRDMLQEAAETREECCVLRARVSELQHEIREKRSWENDERGVLLKEKDKYTRENERLVCQNAVLRAEVAKLSVQTQRLAEENTRCNYDLQLKKEKTKLKSRKDTQNIAEIHQIIQHSVQTLHNNHAHTLKNLRQTPNNAKNMQNITPNNVPFHQSIVHAPSSPTRTPLADTLNTSHIKSINQQHQYNQDFTPSNSLSTSQVYSYHIPYSSSRSSTPVQNSTYIKQSIQSSRSPIRIANYDNLNNYESFSKTLHKKQTLNSYPPGGYPATNDEIEVTSLKIRNDHENIIQNLSKLQKLDQFLQRSQSNSNIASQQQQSQQPQTHHSALNQQQQKQLQLSNPMMIQITSSFGPLSERTNGMLLNTSSQVSPLSQASPAQLRRSQSFHILSKPPQ